MVFYGRNYWHPLYTQVMGKRTIADVMDKYGDSSRQTLKPLFQNAGVAYPPEEIALLALKDIDNLELWAKSNDNWHYIEQYPILAASGQSGPKLREGDRQVPEGIYQIIGLNPNSSYHLSMKLNYPNAFDLKWAKKEKRNEPGSNIFIHGKAVSIGCLAMGDDVIEDLFTLTHDVGKSNIKVIISPTDPRINPLVPPINAKPWVTTLYQQIETAFLPFQQNKISRTRK